MFTLLGYQPVLGFPPVKKNVTLAQEGLEQKAQIISEEMPNIQLPHPGYLSGKYSSYHPGVDIATSLGMPIHPIAEGIVKEVNLGFFGYGKHIIIAHPKGLISLYAHLDKIYVKKDDRVNLSSIIGTVGLTGFTSGPHTHLEITKDGNYINPIAILPKLEDFPREEFLRPYGGAK